MPRGWRLTVTPGRSVARWWRVLAAVAAAVAVVGCGQAPGMSAGSETTTAGSETTTAASAPSTTVSTVVGAADPDAGIVADDGAGEGGWKFPECRDVPRLSAPAEAYRDKPVYVADEGPVAEVRAWAESQPGYETIWIDRDRFGWISVGFTEGADARQEDLEEEFAGVGVVAVPMEHTGEELQSLAKRVFWRLVPLVAEPLRITASGSASRGVAAVGVPGLTDEIRDEITRRFSGEPLCVSGLEPGPPPGPQPQEGDGWRLLADEGTGVLLGVGLAADAAGLADLLTEIGLGALDLEVDFDKYVVVSFGAVYSSSCPDIRLDDVVVDGAVVYPEIVVVTPSNYCTLDAIPHTYVVALERARLPSGPFVIQTEVEMPSYAKPKQRLRVDADLSKPGSVPDPAAIR